MCLISIIVVVNQIWFIRGSKTFHFLMQHRDRFLQLSDYEGFNTRFSEAMPLEHVPAVVLDVLNNYKYLPELVVINVGASDFTRYTNS